MELRQRIDRWTRGRPSLAAVVGIVLAATACGPQAAPAPQPASPEPTVPGGPTYRMYVANESSDVVSRVAFSAQRGAWVERSIPVGLMPSDNDGAHGISVSPDGQRWFLTLAHGSPNGFLWTFEAGTDSLIARTELGLFPATMGLTPDGSFLMAVNFNLHGDRVPSNVSVVHLPSQTQLARIDTCVTPHGSRIDPTGRFHYSACMRSEQLVEIDMNALAVSRRFSLEPDAEGALSPDDLGADPMGMGGMAMGSMCMPTWAEPGVGAVEGLVYVTCNRAGYILEIDTESWTVSRRFESGAGPYNLDVTPDGRMLVASLKGEQAVQLIDLASGREVARIPTSRSVTHGVVVAPDGRYAFISNESVGSVPGTVDVIDLDAATVVATVEVGQQAGGIDFWTMDELDESGRAPRR